MDDVTHAVMPPDPEVIQVGDAIWERPQWLGLVQGARCTANQERSPPGADSAICANSVLAGPIELITLRDEPPRKRLLATAGQALAAVCSHAGLGWLRAP